MDTVQKIKDEIGANKVILFMKGTPDFPQCGFSMQAARVLQQYDIPFTHVDVIAKRKCAKTYRRYPIGRPSRNCLSMVSLSAAAISSWICTLKVS